MIAPMRKYNFVLFYEEKEPFLEKLQDLGLVDVTTADWEPNDNDREIMQSIERHRKAVARLKEITGEKDYTASEPMKEGGEAYRYYLEASSNYDWVVARLAQAEKEYADLKVWGKFDSGYIQELARNGVVLHYFSMYTKEFEARKDEWDSEYNLVPINFSEGVAYFVIITPPDVQVNINAHESKAPSADYMQIETEIEYLRAEKQKWSDELRRCAGSIDLIAEEGAREEEKLHFSCVANTVRNEAEGNLILMEGWATQETEDRVDAMLEEYPNLFYVKSDPTPDDDIPVLLKNNKTNKLFEFIGNFYSLPKYGTMDLTPSFGPFYVLFFGLCLADAGYGLLYLLGGAYMLKKMKPSLHGVAKLVILCGLATIICGIFMGSFFGIPFAEYKPFAFFRDFVLSTDNLFVLALGIGVIQILFGMLLKAITLTRSFGFRYSLATLGWMIVIISGFGAYFAGARGVEWFTTSSPAFLVSIGTGIFMMLFLNSPGKNIFMNFGTGLWDAYNAVTGFLGDVLSYIRLFAIGLSGGTLALVFNQLAFGLTEPMPIIARQLVILIILLIGHGINLFMGTLSSFVHPMRLTFVEFYKNAGFESAPRGFEPFKRGK